MEANRSQSLLQDAKNAARDWANCEVYDEQSRKEVLDLLEQNKDQEIIDRFYKDLEFGTGGLRGIYGVGTARINIYNIRRATQAFCDVLNKEFSHVADKKAAISYDSRLFSFEFAKASCEVFAANGIQPLLTKDIRPTPIVSFAVRHYECIGGLCLTASHNPPEYQGYKVYWRTGGQVVPPYDEKIIAAYQGLKDPKEVKWIPFDDTQTEFLGSPLDDAYFRELSKNLPASMLADLDPSLSIVFTPLHGTSVTVIPRVLQEYGFKNFSMVAEQTEPDGRFPTVASPNPENQEALEMALQKGKAEGAELIFGTDPDGDRLGVYYLNSSGGYSFLNGNQMAAVMIEYVLRMYQKHQLLKKNHLVVSTIVTSDLIKKICEKYDVVFAETLTGFKWICDLVDRYETGELQPPRTFLCGAEESYGFLFGSFVRDKDATSAALLMSMLMAEAKANGLYLDQVLDAFYREHGFFYDAVKSLTKTGQSGAQEIKEMMEALRSDPPSQLGGVAVAEVLDYAQSVDGLPKSNVLQFKLENGSKISVRPSGTEPKIKFYFSLYQKDFESTEKTTQKAQADLELIQKDLFGKNN